jgi:cyclohexyl-isocyanide hydratase
MKFTIGLLVFPKVQQLDLTGPYEVFASLPDVRVELVWKTLEPVTSATGLVLTPTITFADCPALDVICVPGGAGVNALMQDEEALNFIKIQASHARFVTSVCTGALVLGAARLLQGRRATTHWNALNLLPAFGAIAVNERVVRDDHLFTGGGVTAGIDFALTIAAALVGQAKAEAVQLNLEYAPSPPFNAGTPETASADTIIAVKAASAKIRIEREEIIAAWRAA